MKTVTPSSPEILERTPSRRQLEGAFADFLVFAIPAVQFMQIQVVGKLFATDVLVLADRLAQPPGQDVAAGADADDRGRVEVAVALDDLMSDAGDRTTDVVGAEQDGAWRCHWLIPFPASQDRSLKVMRCRKYTSG